MRGSKPLLAGFFAFIVVSGGCVQPPNALEESAGDGVKNVSFSTSDHVVIGATLFEPLTPTGKSVVLIPMMGHTRSTFNVFAQRLQEKGFRVLALDVRGHGESTQGDGKKISYQSFSSAQWNDAVKDIQAGQDFLKAQKVFVVGASIGANLAALYAGQNPERVQGLVLLSPGLDYKGVQPKPALESFEGPVLVMASMEDAYSFDSSGELEASAAGPHAFVQLKNVGHGTNLFVANPDLMNTVIDWLEKN
ncbi:MAG: alpha/beta hydrolase [Candidatus Diapherotrites archaeon]|nr:alpha/beta hydrolase [Candidatus Diapherotrites archaeon]